MKLTAIILFSACLAASANGYSQNVTLSGKNVPLEKMFSTIEKQTNYVFFYNYGLLKDAKPVTIEANNISLQEVLKLLFKDQPLDYSIKQQTIFITKKLASPKEPNPNETFLTTTIDVSGKVTDTDGKPLEGATVTVTGTKLVTRTDAAGVFILKAIDEEATLEISYAEYETVIIKVNKRTSISIALKQEIGKLNEVIINKGYYTEKQRNTVGNVTTITAKDIEKSPVQNVLLAIQGRVPGIEITQLSGLNGGGVKIQIQGNNSIGSLTNLPPPNQIPITRTDPLIIIDGVPFANQLTNQSDNIPLERMLGGGSPLNYINPDDIESISILKDADATSLYGSRAANGAILITTKKGKAGKNKISVNLQQGWGQVSRRVDMMNTQQYLAMRREALKNANQIASSNPSATAPFTYARDLSIWDTTRYTDWQDVLIGGTAKYTNINVSVSGGNHLMQYLIGGTFNRTTTVFPEDFDDKRSSLHFNISNNAGEQRLKVGLSGSYMFDDNKLPGVDLTAQAIQLAPNAPALYNPDGSLNWAPNAAGTSTWVNPLAYTQSADFINTTKNLVANLNLRYRLAKGLDLQTSVGYTSMQGRIFTPFRIEWFAPQNRATAQRSASLQNRNLSNWIIEPQLNYQTQFSKAIITANIATTIQKTDADILGISSSGYTSDQLMGTLQAATTISITNSANSIERYNALFGRFNFSWDNKYIFNFTARRDGSNKFGENERFNNFWSTGAAWIFSDETAIQKALPFLSFGKLRASYGITGNDQIKPFSYLNTYSIGSPSIPYQGGSNIINNGTANPYLKWEETRKWQSGIDLGIFNSRINLGFTYARNRSSNQLITYSLPAMANSSLIKNLPATVQNTSLEFTLHTENVKTKDFSWTTSANLTIPRNKLVSFPGIENTIFKDPFLGVVIGQPLGVLSLFKYAGVDPATGKFIAYNRHGDPDFIAGLLDSDRTALIFTGFKYYGGLQNSFTCKGFQLEFLIQLVRRKAARDMVWNNGVNTWPGQFGSNQPLTVLDHWQKPGDVAHSPLYHTSVVTNLVTISDAYYNYDASYARLKNVSLSWQMPKKWMPKNGFTSARFYAHAQNLATITNYKGIDPESGATGMPPLRMITVGAQVEF